MAEAPNVMALRKKGDRMLKEAKLSDRSTIIVDSQNSFTAWQFRVVLNWPAAVSDFESMRIAIMRCLM